MIWLEILLILAVFGVLIRWGARKSREADEDLQSMDVQSSDQRLGIFSVLKGNRRR